MSLEDQLNIRVILNAEGVAVGSDQAAADVQAMADKLGANFERIKQMSVDAGMSVEQMARFMQVALDQISAMNANWGRDMGATWATAPDEFSKALAAAGMSGTGIYGAFRARGEAPALSAEYAGLSGDAAAAAEATYQAAAAQRAQTQSAQEATAANSELADATSSVTAATEEAAAATDGAAESAASLAAELRDTGATAAEAYDQMVQGGLAESAASQGVAAAFQEEAAAADEAAAANDGYAESSDTATAASQRLRGGVDVTATGLHGYLSGARSSMNAFAEAIGATMALHFADRMSEQVIQLSNLAATTGSTVAQLAEFEKVLEQNGVDANSLQNTLISLSSAMTKAAAGNKQAVASFQELGIDTSNWKNQMPGAVSVLLQMSDAMHNATNATQATGAAQQLLGFYGIHMISVLSQGPATLRKLMDAMSGYGDTIQSNVGSARAFETAWVRVKASLEVGLLPTLPLLTDAIKALDIVTLTSAHAIAAAFELAAVGVIDAYHGVKVAGDLVSGNYAALAIDSESAKAEMTKTWDEFADHEKRVWASVVTEIAGLGGAAADAARGHLTLPTPGAEGKAGKPKSAKSYIHDETAAAAEDDKLFVAQLQKDTDAINLQIAERVVAFEKSISPITAAESREAQGLFASLQKVQEQRAADQLASVADAESAALSRLKVEQSADQQKLALGEITRKQEVSDLENFENQRYAIKRQAIEREIALLEQYSVADPENPKYLTQLKSLHKQIETLETQHQLTMTKLATQAAQAAAAPYKTMMGDVNRAFASSIDGMVRGTQTFSMAMARMWQSILGEFLASIEQMAMRWAETELEMLLVSSATNKKEILGDAPKAASGAYKATVGIPFVGPAIAPVAAATAFAAVAAFAGDVPSAAGGWVVPQDSLAMVHEREMVLPAELSDRVRKMTAGPQTFHMHYTPTVHALDKNGVREVLRNNRDEFMSEFKRWMRDMALI